MYGKQGKHQAGFALLIFLIIMMGLAGIALTGVTQGIKKEVDNQRYRHNQKALNKAKQALLWFAYNYPQTNVPIGPGRLPCPDDDNNGLVGAGPTIFQCNSVGRFPWLDTRLNFSQTLNPSLDFSGAPDASGEHLWYAVSQEFRNVFPSDVGGNINGDNVVNSESTGSITIFDQSGNLLYDGAVSGIAAVIIAPGPPISRDDDNDGIYEYQQVRGTVAEKNDPKNYLDTFNNFDNSTFTNALNTPVSGFILGPIREPDTTSSSLNTIVVNDQMVVITADEVIAMAEKATLQAYRDAIDTYQQNIWGAVPANYRYPWLDPYNSPDDLMAIPSPLPVSDPIIGRVPSTFGEYFNTSASESIKSQIEIDIQYDDVTWNDILPIVDVNFNALGDLETSSTETFTKNYYAWDGHSSTPDANSPQDGVWELCTGTAGTGPGGTGNDDDDCNRKTDGSFKIPGDLNDTQSDVWLEVKRITLIFNQTAGIITFINNDLIGLPLQYVAPSGLKHALVSADYNNNSAHLDITSEIDINFRSSFGAPFPGPAFGVNPADRIRVGIRYYPELPIWVLDNLWHDKIMLAYSAALQADAVDNICTLPVLPFTVATSLTSDYCLILENSAGITNDKAAVLFSAGTAIPGLVDDGVPGYIGFADELDDIFEGENATPAFSHSDNTFWTAYYNPAPPPPDYVRLEANLKFDRRPDNANDITLVLQ